MPRPYDLAVAYRVYPGLSRNGFPGVRDKQALIAGCLRSFKEAIGDLHVKMWVILDGCPESTAALFRAQFDEEDLVLVRMEKAGNARTFLEQLSVLTAQSEAEAGLFRRGRLRLRAGSAQPDGAVPENAS